MDGVNLYIQQEDITRNIDTLFLELRGRRLGSLLSCLPKFHIKTL